MQEPIDADFHEPLDEEAFKFYRDFINVEAANDFVILLQEQKIPYLLESSDTIIDTAIVGNGLIPGAIVKLLPKDFKRVNELIAGQFKNLKFADVKDHYLNQLETEELRDILKKQDEWSIEDISVAKIILRSRGVAVEETHVEQLREDRLSEIRQGAKGSWGWMSFYTLCMVFGLFFSYLFPIAGIGMSYYYAYGKSNDADGNRYYVYEAQTRQIGTFMLYGGITLIIIEYLFIRFVLIA